MIEWLKSHLQNLGSLYANLRIKGQFEDCFVRVLDADSTGLVVVHRNDPSEALLLTWSSVYQLRVLLTPEEAPEFNSYGPVPVGEQEREEVPLYASDDPKDLKWQVS